MVGLRVVSVRRERMLPAAPPLVTLPIVLIALLKFSEFAVQLFKAPVPGRLLTGTFHPTRSL
jgi:hypothetical protein